MSQRNYDAERYNRRTRAIEKQAAALGDIARALEALALVQATRSTSRQWVNDSSKTLFDRAWKRLISL